MKQVTISELKKLKAGELKSLMPVEVTENCEVIGEFSARGKLSTRCPNCGLVYDTQKPEDIPFFFSVNPK